MYPPWMSLTYVVACYCYYPRDRMTTTVVVVVVVMTMTYHSAALPNAGRDDWYNYDSVVVVDSMMDCSDAVVVVAVVVEQMDRHLHLPLNPVASSWIDCYW